MSDQSDEDKTEDPTPHRLSKAREEGQVPRSRELTSLLMLAGGWALMGITGSRMARQLAGLLAHGLTFNNRLLQDPGLMVRQLNALFVGGATALLPFSAGLLLVAIASPPLIGGLFLSGKALKMDLSRLSPLAGFRRIFSMHIFSDMFKSVLKVILVSAACFLFIRVNWEYMLQLSAQSDSDAIHDAISLILKGLLVVVLSLIPMVAYDVMNQLLSYTKKLRMTRQEIRDEFKEQEGNPQIKGKIRQMQRAAARRRMMSDVPKADVIVNNPTHFSVAIQYKEGDMSAPVMLAKGTGIIALRIREEAAKHGIPMLEAPSLARALYRHCEIGDEIPAALYSAVAEVLAWVYGLRRWRASGGFKPQKPVNLPVPTALDFKHESHN